MLEPAPGVEFGRYVMVGQPAYHGAGSLVAAREARSGARRTLWLVMPHVVAEPEQRAPVVSAALALRRLASPHLVQLHEFGEVDGQPFFATAPLDGVDLTQVCTPDGIPPEDALDLIAQVGTGINHLHHAGLVDGALGPGRVLVEDREGGIHASVAHAGILPVLMSTSALFGSQKQEALDFGAPEVHRGEAPTVRSDVYSLGCLLWLALTGEPPFASYAAHGPAPIPQVAGDGPVEQAINSVLQRALAKDPADRYRDAAAFVATLRSIAALAREGVVGELPARVVPRGPGEPDVQVAFPAAPATHRAEAAGEESAAPAPVAEAPAAPPAAQAPASGPAPAESPAHRAAHAAFVPEPGLAAAWEPPAAAGEAAVVPAVVPALLTEAPEAEPDRALKEAMRHWAARTSAQRKLHGPRTGRRVLRAGAAAAVVGALALVTVWGARHTDFLDRTEPASATSTSASTVPSATAPGAETPAPLERLFPIAGAKVCRFDTEQAAHRIERWTCQRTGYRVVLTHWDSHASARDLVPHGGAGGVRERWMLRGTHAGTQWTWRSAAGPRPYRWTGVYADVPYAVVIEASSKARRREARAHVVIHPSTVLG